MDVLSTLLLVLFLVGHLVLAGADVGLSMLMPRVARGPAQRRRVVAAIAPYFLASEVWLVALVGILAGLFPALEHHVVAELWPVLVVLTVGLLVRDAGLWLRSRVPDDRWRAVWDGAVVAGGWTLALAWGWVTASLIAGDPAVTPFTVACASTVVSLFALRGAAFGAERLVEDPTAESADVAARDTRWLAGVALAATLVTVVAAVPGPGPVDPSAAAIPTAVMAVALTATLGTSGPMLSRYTSAIAIAVPGVTVAVASGLPVASIPDTTAVLVWSVLTPAIPVMLIGQVWLYRMTRRPSRSPGFFA
ncbi:cytochrome d ubiquinol oxidase subunit II [Nocardiopsis sp. N85]|uniref:cytochrome d ubiquinol oxidase subunit II n=1 Tax=Nocardiopsis sp. N85 TaxID=3029400 RepID=UPI00237F8337|nr:cytochrome d ubiquinol oxidase subunit II [Nocardiopsis sp. N85]MDE3721257.1 cytochrome d ubiquinol oxidase subunit II [Nocardiopsis sp. N85]